MALRESGSPSLRSTTPAWDEFDPLAALPPRPRRIGTVLLFIPLGCALAAPVLYLLYALGII